MGSNIKIIDRHTQVKEWEGKTQIGIKFVDGDYWVNAVGDAEYLEELLKTMIWKGNTISFDLEDGLISNISVVEQVPKPKGRPSKVEQPQSQSQDGGKFEDEMVTFETLLSAAHNKKQPFSITTEMLAVDLEKKYALFKARVVIYGAPKEEEEGIEIVFEGHGDATADNVKGEFIKPHFIRMAETRAIVRALRWYTNNATCAEEEKGEAQK